ncbi:MAG TPA: MerR family transcriptional regulator [Coriobacteriia bacterium]
MGLTVGEVAQLASISVRTLHHYDELGLLTPSVRTEAGYRLYSDADLACLQQVLFFKELGFGLGDIARIMHDPQFDRLEALRMQRRMLMDKSSQLALMAEAVDAAIDAEEGGVRMDAKDMFDAFGDFDPKEYEKEAEERWGNTAAYKESARRTKRYTKEDWIEVRKETEAVNAGLAKLMDEGVPADDPRAMDQAEQHRLNIDRRFYPVSYEMHVGLAEMYIADPRFAANYEKVHAGLAHYMHDAILANAARMK